MLELDQDATAIAERYDLQEPAAVATEVADASDVVAADRILVQRLGRYAGVIRPATHTVTEGVAIMTGVAEAA